MTVKILAAFILLSLSCTFISAQEADRVIEDGGTGKYTAIMTTDVSLPTHTLFRPKDLSAFGGKNKLPVIVWGNGACFNSPWEHVNFLSEIASHGYLVIAIGKMPKESGDQVRGSSKATLLLDAIDWITAQNNAKKSIYYKKIATNMIAASGMSCGGLQTLEVAGDKRLKTIIVCNSGIFIGTKSPHPAMPALEKDQLKKIHTPTLYLLGGPSDIAYKNGMDDFSQINHVPVMVANLDVGHGGTYAKPHGGEFARVALEWYNWQLKGDVSAAKMFTGNPPDLAGSAGWTVQKKNMH
ncbi:MAG: alpha/beta hydrolase [Pedobacter sp.]|nr:MAG: alpha/beta hydrolase [Pedobacter sp.]